MTLYLLVKALSYISLSAWLQKHCDNVDEWTVTLIQQRPTGDLEWWVSQGVSWDQHHREPNWYSKSFVEDLLALQFKEVLKVCIHTILKLVQLGLIRFFSYSHLQLFESIIKYIFSIHFFVFYINYHISEKAWYLSLWDWLISLKIMGSSYIHFVAKTGFHRKIIAVPENSFDHALLLLYLNSDVFFKIQA